MHSKCEEVIHHLGDTHLELVKPESNQLKTNHLTIKFLHSHHITGRDRLLCGPVLCGVCKHSTKHPKLISGASRLNNLIEKSIHPIHKKIKSFRSDE